MSTFSYGDPALLPHDSYVGEIWRLNIAFIAVTAVAISIRMLVRIFAVKHVASDDYLMVAAGLFSIAFSTMNMVGIGYGLGRHIWDLPQTVDLLDRTKKVIQTLWICQIMYVTALMLVKISIVASYLRVFPTTLFRWTMYVLSVAMIGVWLCSIFVTIFQCHPVVGAWDYTLPRNCLPIVKFYYFTTAFSIFTDFLLCTLPLPVFWRLKLPRQQKYIVSALFAVGLFATVASALRISVLKDVDSLDVSMGSVSTMKWSVVEVGTGVICACIPCYKPLFKNFLGDRSSAKGSNPRAENHSPMTPKTYQKHFNEEVHELTKPSEGWTSWSQSSRMKGGPVTTTKNFV